MELRQFVGEIVFYLTVFGATVFLREGNQDYVLFGTLMNLLSDDHINTYATASPLNIHLNNKGRDILSTYGQLWNKDSNGFPVWSYGDLIPGWLVMLYTNEILSVKSKFNNIFQLSGGYRIRGLVQKKDL